LRELREGKSDSTIDGGCDVMFETGKLRPGGTYTTRVVLAVYIVMYILRGNKKAE
jgi:hypothetical protein